jgi:hypothetical protein
MQMFPGKFLSILLASFLQFSASAQISDSLFHYYQSLNNKEDRLIAYKDGDGELRIKLKQLERINESRRKHHVNEVMLDIFASRVANKQCREAARYKYISHWNMNGEKPYHRYAFAGGYDHVSENAYGSISTEKLKGSLDEMAEAMREGHQAFMDEKAPYDGHKQNCIAPEHNYVGIGYALRGGHFRYYEEFIDRYYEFRNIPSRARVRQTKELWVKPKEGNYLYALFATRDPELKERKPIMLTFKGAYLDAGKKIEYSIMPDEMKGYRQGEWYVLPVSFPKPGYYYILIYQDDKEGGSASFGTKDKIQASGIVIKVGRP